MIQKNIYLGFMKMHLSDDCLESLFADAENISGEHRITSYAVT